jgi:phosphoesterase RecJ-like protein
MFNSPQWAEAMSATMSAERLLLVTHEKPDGDAVGSLVALANALRENGKTPLIVVDGGVPDYLRFVTGSEHVKPVISEGDFDVMISLDASDEIRTGKAGAYGRAHSGRVINIDHHPTNTGFGDLHIVVPTAVSTTEILFDWFKLCGITVSPAVAMPLLTGLVTDTLGFRTNNVTARTLEIASALMMCDAPLYEIMSRTLVSTTWQSVQMWKFALETVRMKNRVIAADITQSALKRLGLTQVGDTGGLIGYLISVEKAHIAVVFKEHLENKVEISFRAKPGYDVSEVAFSLGGGGHKLASGATVDGTLDEVKARVMPLLVQAAKAEVQ